MDVIDRLFDALIRRHYRAGLITAVGLVAASIALRLAFPTLRYPFLIMMPAVLISALVGGWRPAMLAGFLSLMAALYLPGTQPRGVQAASNSLVGLLMAATVFATQIVCIEAVRLAARRGEARRRRADELLAERDVMFRELQHRVANNMQFVAGLLCLEGMRLPEGNTGREVMNEASERLLRFASIHRRLHDAHSGERSFEALARDVLSELLLAVGCDHVTLIVQVPPVRLPLDAMTTLILITTEAATNAAKHVFAANRGSRLMVTLEREGDYDMALTIADDGPGFPAGFAPDAGSRLGFKILRSLVNRLRGRMVTETEGGAVVRVRFPMLEAAAAPPEQPGLAQTWRRMASLAEPAL